jgi:FkbM family methyltransferase
MEAVMLENFAEWVAKAGRYFFTPFEYPRSFMRLIRLMVTNRPLVRELVFLSEHRQWFAGSNFRTVIDVGGYIGAFSFAIRQMLPETQLYTFEPLLENYQTLVKNHCGDGHLRAFNTALGERRGEVDFWRSDFAPSSSALPMGELHRQAFPHTAGLTKVTVPIARLDDFLTMMTLEGTVLLKIDVQGYEAAVLRGAVETLKQVDCILTEVSFRSLYEGQATFDQLNNLLHEHGFVYAGSFDTLLSPLDGSILQSDALFVRQNRKGSG